MRLGLERVLDGRRPLPPLGGAARGALGDARLVVGHEIVALLDERLREVQDVQEALLAQSRVLEFQRHKNEGHLLRDMMPDVPLAGIQLGQHVSQNLAKSVVRSRLAVPALGLFGSVLVPSAQELVPVQEVAQVLVQPRCTIHELRRLHAPHELANIRLAVPVTAGPLVLGVGREHQHALPGHGHDALRDVPEELLADRQGLVGCHHAVRLEDFLISFSIERSTHSSHTQAVGELLLDIGDVP
mmetsp:Transcript_9286/g.23071  ORF Transcript_9286/g.23071 Transcript_9286/m.23071 type:complete len:243 (-) Transcript_9286:468-1196(-)